MDDPLGALKAKLEEVRNQQESHPRSMGELGLAMAVGRCPEAIQDQFHLWVIQNPSDQSHWDEYQGSLRALIRHRRVDLLEPLEVAAKTHAHRV